MPEEEFCMTEAPDGAETEKKMEELLSEYPVFTKGEMGKSIEGRPISFLRIGRGQKNILYVGTHHAMENITAAILLRFAEDLARNRGKKLYGLSLPYLLETRSFYFVPMLNPDGVHLRLYGSEEGELLHERKMRMTGETGDFSHWQANARGVDLNHNYDAGFASYKMLEVQNGIVAGATRYSGAFPLSEPESAALAAMVQSLSPTLILSLHTQGQEIYAAGAAASPAIARIGRSLATLSGYTFTVPEEEMASYGGLADWAGGVLGIPSFTVECGKGENPLPFSCLDGVYANLRRMLFLAPVV